MRGGPLSFRRRHVLGMLREIVETEGHEQLLAIVDAAFDGDRWAELQCAGAVSAALQLLLRADRIKRGTLDTPAVTMGTPS